MERGEREREEERSVLGPIGRFVGAVLWLRGREGDAVVALDLGAGSSVWVEEWRGSGGNHCGRIVGVRRRKRLGYGDEELGDDDATEKEKKEVEVLAG